MKALKGTVVKPIADKPISEDEDKTNGARIYYSNSTETLVVSKPSRQKVTATKGLEVNRS
jgi:hypothetical protein